MMNMTELNPASENIADDHTNCEADLSVEKGSVDQQLLTKEETEKTSFTNDQKRILCVALMAYTLSFAGVTLPAPFLPVLDEKHNISSDITGWILGIYSLVQLIMFSVFGKLIPRIGARRTLLFGELVCGISLITFGLLEYLPVPDPTDKSIDVTYLVLAIVIRIIQAMGATAFLTAAMTLLMAGFPNDVVAMLSYGEAACGFGLSIEPALGSLFYKVGGFVTVLGGVGGIVLLVFVISYFLLPVNDYATKEAETTNWTIKEMLTHPNVLLSVILIFFFGMFYMMNNPTLEPELQSKFNLRQESSSLVFLANPVFYFLSAPIASKFREKLRKVDNLYCMAVTLLLGFITCMIMGPSPLFVGLQRPLWVLVITLALQGFFTGVGTVFTLELAFIPMNRGSELTREMNSATQALVSGIWLTMLSFGNFLSPILSGMFIEKMSYGWTTTIYGVMCLVLAVMVLLIQLYRVIRNRYGKLDSENKPLLK